MSLRDTQTVAQGFCPSMFILEPDLGQVLMRIRQSREDEAKR